MTDANTIHLSKAIAAPAITIDLRVMNRVLLIIAAVALVGYLAAVNSLSVRGFILRDYKIKAGVLEQDNQTMEIETATLQSQINLTDRLKNLNMVADGDVQYLGDTRVLAKK